MALDYKRYPTQYWLLAMSIVILANGSMLLNYPRSTSAEMISCESCNAQNGRAMMGGIMRRVFLSRNRHPVNRITWLGEHL